MELPPQDAPEVLVLPSLKFIMPSLCLADLVLSHDYLLGTNRILDCIEVHLVNLRAPI